ncbi:MAG TPA: hypothetical protein VMV33_12975 [Rhodocyclaceae bacterium]|nr:hypothetical protein [Rhodocyclaceae bacterium]
MTFSLCVPLNTSPEQAERLQALQKAFADVCNAIAPVVQQTRCWNRVGLHHLAYRSMRERFPQVGSQMVCNAIYSVSRTCRLVLQHPNSPLNIAKRPGAPLPLLVFQANAPVYFDRHTLSLKDGVLSMFTLDGRMRFQLALQPADEARFHRDKLREIVLSNSAQGYQLVFSFSPEDETEAEVLPADAAAEFPEYLIVTPGIDPAPAAVPTALPPRAATAPGLPAH